MLLCYGLLFDIVINGYTFQTNILQSNTVNLLTFSFQVVPTSLYKTYMYIVLKLELNENNLLIKLF